MSKKEETIKVEDLEKCEGTVILDVPDDVYVANGGKVYYPEKTGKATLKRNINDVDAKGYKPSKAYQKFVEELYKKQQEGK